jgi:hypothetical protein
MKRLLLPLAAAAAAAAFAVVAVRQAPDAQAVAATQVVGTYKIKLKGDGWWRGATTAYRPERVNGTALLLLARSVPDDGKLKVVIQADATGSLVDIATPTPDFSGTGVLVGDSITVIGSGQPTYVNGITITFLKGGARVLGHWFASFPPSDAAVDSSAAGGLGIDFTGRRLTKRDEPVTTASSASPSGTR